MFFPVTDLCSPAVSILYSCTTIKRVFLVFLATWFAVISLTTCLLSRWQPFQPGFIANEWKMSNKSTINMRQRNYCIHCDYSVPARRFCVKPLQHFNIYWEGICWKPRSEETFVTAFRKWWVQLFNSPAVPTTHPPQIRLLHLPPLSLFDIADFHLVLCC